MPRFFFDFCDGRDHSVDYDGSEFSDADEAYAEAYKAAEEMWGDLISRRIDPRPCTFEVRDASRVLIFVLPFRDVLEHCRGCHRPSPLVDTLRQSLANAAHAKRANEEFRRQLQATRNSLNEAIVLIATPI